MEPSPSLLRGCVHALQLSNCLVLCSPLFHGTLTYWEQDICSWTSHQGSANLPKACQAQLPKPPKCGNYDIHDSRAVSE